MQNLNNDYVNILDNVNVSQESDFGVFFKILAWLAGICVIAYIVLSISCSIVISNLSSEKQIALEKVLASGVDKKYDNVKVDRPDDIKRLRDLEQRILPLNKKLREHGSFPLYIIKADYVNAFVSADGSIYITEKLLDEIKDDEQLCFILAHEIGHYLHKDHLQMLSRTISGTVVALGVAVASGGNQDIDKIISGSINFAETRYSKKDEFNADAFANSVVKKLYGSNKEAIAFFKYIEKSSDEANFLYFFSTHPSPDERIKELEKSNKN